MAVLLYNGIGVLLTVGPEGVEFEEHAKEGEDAATIISYARNEKGA